MSRKQYGLGNVYARGKVWWIVYSLNGQTIRESSKSHNKSDATNLLKQRLSEIGRGDTSAIGPNRITVHDLLQNLLRDYRLNGKSIEWAEIVVKHLEPHFGYHRAAAVNSDLIARYIDRRRSAQIKNSTINRELALLRRGFYLALHSDPPKVARVPKIPKFDEKAFVRTGFFERSEFEAVREALPEEIRPVVTFAYYTGCRKGELLCITWDQVDLKGGIVVLHGTQTKSGEPRMIPLTRTLRELLTELKSQRDELWPDCRWVFSRNGRQILDFKGSWAMACETAGVSKYFHDLRRTGVRNLVRAGVPEKVAMSISGHKTRAVFERYNIVTVDDLRDAAERLERTE